MNQHRSIVLLLAGVCALPALSARTAAQVVFATDRWDSPVYLVDVEFDRRFQLLRPYRYGGSGAWAMAGAEALGAAYLADGEHLSLIHAQSLRPEYLGIIRVGGEPAPMLGLAWNGDAGVLYGLAAYPVWGVYSIDLQTLEATLLVEIDPVHNAGALDYDHDTQTLLALFDGQGANGGAIYRIDLDERRYEFVATYPGQGNTDIDGLAAAGGRAYLVADRPESIFVYDLVAGAYLDPLQSPIQNVNNMSGATWAPSFMNRLLVSDPVPGRIGRSNRFHIVGGRPNSTVYLVGGYSFGATPLPGCPGTTIEVASPRVIDDATIGADGRGQAGFFVPPALLGRPVYYHVVDPQGCQVSNLAIFAFGPDL